MALNNFYQNSSILRFMNELDNFYYRPWPTRFPSYLDAFDGVDHFEKTDTGYLMEIMVPGFTKNNLEVEILDGKYLSVHGEVSTVRKGSNMERKFSQKWLIPRDVDTDSLKASVENGILTVNMHKREVPSKRDVQRIHIT